MSLGQLWSGLNSPFKSKDPRLRKRYLAIPTAAKPSLNEAPLAHFGLTTRFPYQPAALARILLLQSSRMRNNSAVSLGYCLAAVSLSQ